MNKPSQLQEAAAAAAQLWNLLSALGDLGTRPSAGTPGRWPSAAACTDALHALLWGRIVLVAWLLSLLGLMCT